MTVTTPEQLPSPTGGTSFKPKICPHSCEAKRALPASLQVVRVIKDGTSESISLWQSLGKQAAAPVRTPLFVYRFGGSVRLNGHVASQRLKGSELLGPGNTYVLFLQWTGSNYHLAGGMSGAVLVDKNLVTRPLGTKESTKLQKYNGLDLETFIQDILTEPEG